MEGKGGDEGNKATASSSGIAPVAPRTVTGACHATNSRAVDWSASCGLVAFASNCLVVLVDPVSLQVAQTLDKHRSLVTKVQWLRALTQRHAADRLTLASADSAGHVVVWNAKSGEAKAVLRDGSRPVHELEWADGRVENTGHLLLALHPPATLVLWDTASGSKVWRKTYAETLLGFDFDPFDTSRMAFRCQECILFSDDFSYSRGPGGSGKKFYVLGPSRDSPTKTAVDTVEEKGKRARIKIKRLMKEFVMGDVYFGGGGQSGNDGDKVALSECLQVTYHRSVRNHLLLVYPREVLILDLDLGQTVGLISFDRNGPPVVDALSCRQRDAVFLLNEHGSLSLRCRRKLYQVACTPMVEPIRNMSKSVAATTPVISDATSDSFSADNVLEISFEQRACSEGIRLGKNARVLGMAVNPVTESSVAISTSDGRLFFVDCTSNPDKNCGPPKCLEDLLPSSLDMCAETPTALRLYTSGILAGLCMPPFVIRMCPPLTLKNLPDYVPHLAVGASSGNVQIVNAATGRVEREFAVHTFPVRGIEWTGMWTILSHAHQTLSGGHSLVRNELFHMDIRTGRSESLRSHRAEEPPIEMVRVSHLKQYFIVSFSPTSGAPFELWDLRNMTLLRTMPKKFPPVTALDWSPLHNLKSLRKKLAAEEKEKATEETKEHGDQTQAPALVAKEHFVFTDPEGQLYHFSVEGNAIRDGRKLPAEASLGTISCIAWKSDHIVRGDVEGNVNVWDVRTRASHNIATNRGEIKKLRFAPGRGNFKLLALHADCVSVWDVKECIAVSELLCSVNAIRVTDVEWAASDRAVLATADGCLRVTGLNLMNSTSPLTGYTLAEPLACHPLLSNKARTSMHVLLHHQPWRKQGYSLELSAEDGLAEAELEQAKQLMKLLPPGTKKCLEEAPSIASRCLVAARLCGGMLWEAEFWRVACHILEKKKKPLDMRLDVACDQESYRRYQQERVQLHESRAGGSHALRKKVAESKICLGQRDEAVRLLLETEPDSAKYYEDCLLACLAASVEKGAPHSTTKLVATNLIAEGRLWEGVQLLCLVGKAVDACGYLQSCGQWDASLWLAKCRLAGKEYSKVVNKFCEHSMTKEERKRAVLLLLSSGDLVATLDALLASKMVWLAALFLEACKESRALPETSHVMVLTEEISLAYARFLFDCGNAEGAFHFCEKADEKGEVLQRELQLLMTSSSDKEAASNSI